MNRTPIKQMYHRHSQTSKYVFSRFIASVILCVASAAILMGLVYVHPYVNILRAWNAVMRDDSVTTEMVAKKLSHHRSTLYQHWGLYYHVLSKIMRENISEQDLLLLRKNLIREYFYFDTLIPDEDAAGIVPEYNTSALKAIDKSMYMLLGYIDFYRADYETAVKVYWEVLKHYERDDAVRYNYEIALFFRNYTNVSGKDAGVRVATAREEAQKLLPVPSLMKLHRGSSYYMLEREKADSELPPY